MQKAHRQRLYKVANDGHLVFMPTATAATRRRKLPAAVKVSNEAYRHDGQNNDGQTSPPSMLVAAVKRAPQAYPGRKK